MKLGFLGLGKLGLCIQDEAAKRGHKIVSIEEADLVIEATAPDSVVANIEKILRLHKPLVVATTGWEDKEDYIRTLCTEFDGTIIYSPNFSFGISSLSQWFSRLSIPPEFSIQIEEIHLPTKKDTPSGTAKQLSKLLKGAPIQSRREECEGGIHRITIESKDEVLLIEHRAKGRVSFAKGILDVIDQVKNLKGMKRLEEVLPCCLPL